MHGNEINGISIVRKFLWTCIEWKISKRLKWRITVIPLLNPTGFHAMNRYVTIDKKDPNRSFWYNDEQFKSYTNYWADAMIEKFWSKCDYAIDIHDAWWRSALVPHSRIHLCEETICSKCTHEMAKYLDTHVVMEREWQKNMLSVFLHDEYKIPLLTVEAWWWQLIFSKFNEKILKWIHNILIQYNFTEWDIELDNPKSQKIISNRKLYRAKHSWEIYFYKSLWEYVKEWDILWKIYYSGLWESDLIISENEWVIFSQWTWGQIIEWKAMLTVTY